MDVNVSNIFVNVKVTLNSEEESRTAIPLGDTVSHKFGGKKGKKACF